MKQRLDSLSVLNANIPGELIKMEQDYRKPYAEKFVKDIDKNDFKIAISGTVVSKSEKSFLLDDGTGQVNIASENILEVDYVRVFGRIIPYEEGMEIQADVIQDLSKIDKQMHKKLKEVMFRT
jgi:hypothetical protein